MTVASDAALVVLVMRTVQTAIGGMKDKSRFDVVVAACRAGFGHPMVTDSDKQLKGVFGGLMEFYGQGSREYDLLMVEIQALTMISAVERGLPIDFAQMPEIPEDEKSLGVARVWLALRSGEDLEAVRRKIEGEPPLPEQKPAPDWWKADGIDKTWAAFVAKEEECSSLGRALSVAEFQRDWLQNSLTRIGISLVPPHPDHPQNIEMSNKGVDILIKRIDAIRSDVARFRPLTDEELGTITHVLSHIPVPQAMERLVADENRLTLNRVFLELRSAIFRVSIDDPATKSS